MFYFFYFFFDISVALIQVYFPLFIDVVCLTSCVHFIAWGWVACTKTNVNAFVVFRGCDICNAFM